MGKKGRKNKIYTRYMQQETDTRKKVLIVEDETSLREVLADNLGEKGYRVFEARDGKEGLDLALAEKPEVILLDIMLPKMNGLRVMQKLRMSSEYGKNVPIMMITNLSANQKILKGVMQDRPAYYIEKAGYSIKEVMDKVDVLARDTHQAFPSYLNQAKN